MAKLILKGLATATVDTQAASKSTSKGALRADYSIGLLRAANNDEC